MRVTRICFGVLLGSINPTLQLSAQCPDGSAPPCPSLLVAPARNTVAVLYFDNLSRDADHTYLADGLTEEVIVHLGRLQRLVVTSRAAVRRFRASTARPTALGRSLGVEYIVTGAVRASGTRLRVTVELARTQDGSRLWGEVFDRNSTDLLEIQAIIAEAVATAIAGRLIPNELVRLRTRPTPDPEAYDLYLRGNFFASRFNLADFRRAIAMYDLALARDSTFAPAFAAKAAAWAGLADDWLPPLESYPKARLAAERALAIDTSAGALTALFWPIVALDRDVQRAERVAQRAIDLDPRLPGAQFLSFVLASIRGDPAAAVAAARRAWEIDTFSYTNTFFYAEALGQNRRFMELVAFVDRVGDVMPTTEANGWKGVALLGQRDCAGAVPLLQDATERHFKMDLGAALVCVGRIDEARALTESIIAERQVHYVNAYFVAAHYAALRDRDKAFDWLNRADEERTAYLAYLPTDFRWDSLRSDPRFAVLMTRLGFGARQ